MSVAPYVGDRPLASEVVAYVTTSRAL